MPRMVMALGLALVVAATVGLQAELIVKEAESFPMIVRGASDPAYPAITSKGGTSGGKVVAWGWKKDESGKEPYIEYATGPLPHKTWYLWMRATTTSTGTSTGLKLFVNGKDMGLLKKRDRGLYAWQKYHLGTFSGGVVRIARYMNLCNGGYAWVDAVVLTDRADYNPESEADATAHDGPDASAKTPASDQTTGPRLIQTSAIPSEPAFTGSAGATDPYLYGEPFFYSPWLAALPENQSENNFKYGMSGALYLLYPISDGVSVRNLMQHYYGLTATETSASGRRLDHHAEGGIRTSHSPNYIKDKRYRTLRGHTKAIDKNIKTWLGFTWPVEMAVTTYMDLFNEPTAYVPLDEEYTKLFQEWLIDKYGALPSLNADWGAHHESIAAVSQPDPDGPIELTDRARWLNWMQFRAWTLVRKHEDAFAAVRQHGVMGLPLCTTELQLKQIDLPNVATYVGGNGIAWMGYDLEQLQDIQDISGIHLYNKPAPYTIWTMKLYSGLGSGKPLLNYETGYDKHFLGIWAQIGCGIRLVEIFSARDWPGAMGFGKFNDKYATKDDKLIDRPRNDAFIYGDLGFEIRRWGALFNTSTSERSAVAILHAWTTMLQNPDDPVPFSEQFGLFQAFLKENIPATIISEKMIKQGLLTNYKVLCLPAAVNLEPAVIAAIRKWVEAGGYLLATARSSRYDHYYRGPTLQLGDVFGCGEARFAPCNSFIKMKFASNMPLKEWSAFGGHTVENRVTDMRYYTEITPQPGASVVLQNPNGSAAAVFNRRQKGASLYFGSNLGMMYHFADSSDFSIGSDYKPKEEARRLRLLIAGLARAAGVIPDVRIAAPDGNTSPVAMTRQNAEAATLVFLFPYARTIPAGYLLSLDVRQPVVGVYHVPVGTQGSRVLNPIAWKRQGTRVESVLPAIHEAGMIVIAHDYQPVVSLQVLDRKGQPVTWQDTVEEGAELVLRLAIDNLTAHALAGRVYAESQLWPDRPGFNFMDLKPGERAEADVRVIVGDVTPHDIRPLVVADGVFRYVIEGRAFISQPSTALTLPAAVGVAVKDVGEHTSPVRARVLTALETGSRVLSPYDRQRVKPNATSFTFRLLDLATAAKYVQNLQGQWVITSQGVKVVKWDPSTKTVTFDKGYPGLMDLLLQADYRHVPARAPSERVQ